MQKDRSVIGKTGQWIQSKLKSKKKTKIMRIDYEISGTIISIHTFIL